MRRATSDVRPQDEGGAGIHAALRCQTARPGRSLRAASSPCSSMLNSLRSSLLTRSFEQHLPFPRRVCVRVSFQHVQCPPSRGERSADRRQVRPRLLFRGYRAGEARRASGRRRARSTPGTLASRRSTVAVFGPGPGFASRHFLRGQVEQRSSSRPRTYDPGGRRPGLPSARLRAAALDATPRSAFRTPLECAPR
jgi:hypothetical protein